MFQALILATRLVEPQHMQLQYQQAYSMNGPLSLQPFQQSLAVQTLLLDLTMLPQQ